MIYLRKPDWLKIRLSKGEDYLKIKEIVRSHHLHTICESGDCPNLGECWSLGTATFMILGNICTRNCKFCAVTTGKPNPVDEQEPQRVADSIRLMNLKHCVITSVDRDDLNDYGSTAWAKTVKAIKEINPKTTIEVLIPDFNGNLNCVQKIIDAAPEIISHNLETVRRLTPLIRNKAQYDISLKILSCIADSGVTAKSGIMLGLGETESEVLETMDDLIQTGCKILTIGQYLQPNKENYPVKEYVTPQQFDKYKEIGLDKGFTHVESAPLVRSSYHAEKQIKPNLS